VKKILVGLILLIAMGAAAMGILTFYLIDNFEDGTSNKWFLFDNVKLSIFKNPKLEKEKKDLILESCGENALKVTGTTESWYVGGIGTSLNVEPSEFSRLQIDVMGSTYEGKVKIELYEDSDKSGTIEQDPEQGWKVINDDIWSVEIPILKGGYTRYSIPFSAFSDANPGVGSDKWGEGPILRMQLIFVASAKQGTIECAVDNILITN
jgi:hypothetical protein